MRRKPTITLFLLTMIICLIAPAYSADELFDSKAAAGHIEKGIASLKVKNYDAAINEFEEASAIQPDAEAFYYLGYAYYMKGKSGDSESRKKSIENFDKAYEINPNFTPSRFKPEEAEAVKPRPKQKPVETGEAVQTTETPTTQTTQEPAAEQPPQPKQ